jgi:dihydroorotate dehydrogenase (NAD+) catalytic subunit
MVWQVVNRVSIPVIGIGGIMNAEDALEFLMLGARAIQVGTANFVNPQATMDILSGLENYLQCNKIRDINDIIGSFNASAESQPCA